MRWKRRKQAGKKFSRLVKMLDYLTLLSDYVTPLISAETLQPYGQRWFFAPYCVISSVIMHILFWVIMLLYAIISTIVLFYNLYIIPSIKSNNSLRFFLDRLRCQRYPNISVLINTAKNIENRAPGAKEAFVWGLSIITLTYLTYFGVKSGNNHNTNNWRLLRQ